MYITDVYGPICSAYCYGIDGNAMGYKWDWDGIHCIGMEYMGNPDVYFTTHITPSQVKWIHNSDTLPTQPHVRSVQEF